jgi:nicotinamide mononucleotide (NMN) deamidase PncC
MLVGKLQERAHIVGVLVDNIKVDLETIVCANVCTGGTWKRAGFSPVHAVVNMRISYNLISLPAERLSSSQERLCCIESAGSGAK